MEHARHGRCKARNVPLTAHRDSLKKRRRAGENLKKRRAINQFTGVIDD
jgi:hypothetical protein